MLISFGFRSFFIRMRFCIHCEKWFKYPGNGFKLSAKALQSRYVQRFLRKHQIHSYKLGQCRSCVRSLGYFEPTDKVGKVSGPRVWLSDASFVFLCMVKFLPIISVALISVIMCFVCVFGCYSATALCLGTAAVFP